MGFYSIFGVHHGPLIQKQKALIQVTKAFITFSKAHFIGNEKSDSTRSGSIVLQVGHVCD